MMRKLEDGGAGLGVVCLVAAERAGMLSSALIERAVAVFTVPPKAVLPTLAISVWGVWGGGSCEQ